MKLHWSEASAYVTSLGHKPVQMWLHNKRPAVGKTAGLFT
jgi:hypothetical protein